MYSGTLRGAAGSLQINQSGCSEESSTHLILALLWPGQRLCLTAFGDDGPEGLQDAVPSAGTSCTSCQTRELGEESTGSFSRVSLLLLALGSRKILPLSCLLPGAHPLMLYPPLQPTCVADRPKCMSEPWCSKVRRYQTMHVFVDGNLL